MILFRGLVWDATKGTTFFFFENNTLVVGSIWVAGKEDWGGGAQEGALLQLGGTDQVVLGVATLEFPATVLY